MGKLRFAQAVAICKPVVGAQSAAAKIFKEAAAQLVAARARLHYDLRAGRAAKLRRITARQHLELLERVDREQAVGRAERCQAGQRSRAGLAQPVGAGGYADVGANAVYHEIVRAGSLAVDAELPLLRESRFGYRYAGRKADDRLETTTVERQILNDLTIENRSNCGRPLNNRTIRLHGDDFSNLAHLKLDFERDLIVNLEREATNFGSSKSRMLDGNGVAPGRKLSNGEEPDWICLRFLSYLRADIFHQHTRLRNNSIIFIDHCSSKCGTGARGVDGQCAFEKFSAIARAEVCEDDENTQRRQKLLD